jgi:uncharacterized membrane protein YkoI
VNNPNGKRSLGRWLVAPAMVGALVGGFGIAAAQTGTPSTTAADSPTTTAAAGGDSGAATTQDQATTTTVAPAPSAPSDSGSGSPGSADAGRRGGAGETALTGDTAEKVTAAALKAVPGATVDRVETDNDGSPYEAHLTKADGTHVTVKVNDAFEVTSVDTDPPGGPRGHGGPGRGDETPLTGDTAEKVKAAALKAVPDATVDRVETDSDGSPYEAHMTKADGTHVTAKVNQSFEVTSVENDQLRPPR